MSVWTRIVEGLRSRSFLAAEDGDGPPRARDLVVASPTSGNRRAQMLNVSGFLDKLQDNHWEFAAISRIAFSAPQARLRMKINGAEVKPDNPWLQRLREPNPVDSGFDALEATFAWLESTGNAVWLWDTPVVDTVTAPDYYVIPPTEVEITPDPKVKIAKYTHRVGNEGKAAAVDYSLKEVCHFKLFNPFNALWGLPPAALLTKVLDTEAEAADYNLRFFKQGAHISGVLEYPGTIPEADFNRLQSQFADRYHGVKNQHIPVILEGGLTWKPTGAPPKDIEFLQGRRYGRESILAVHGVPPALAGVFEYANYSNAEAQYLFFWNETLSPRLSKVAEGYAMFLRRNGIRAECWFDTTDVPALRETPAKLGLRLSQIVLAGVLTINEARELLGHPPLPEGDVTVNGLSSKQGELALAAAKLIDVLTAQDASKLLDPLLDNEGLDAASEAALRELANGVLH